MELCIELYRSRIFRRRDIYLPLIDPFVSRNLPRKPADTRSVRMISS